MFKKTCLWSTILRDLSHVECVGQGYKVNRLDVI